MRVIFKQYIEKRIDMACDRNITTNDRSFDCFLPLYTDSTSDNDRQYGSRFSVNSNTNVETRFMDVDRLQNDLEQTTIMMDSHVDNFKRFMKSVHESFYKNFNIATVTNQQISRISKAVNITNQTFAALDLWLSVFSDHVTELYDEIEIYQNSKTKIVLIMNKIKQQETSLRTDMVVKFKRDEAFKQSLYSERNRLVKTENSIRSKLHSLNNYYAKFERGLIPADRKSEKMINLKTILKVADMIYGTTTKLTDLQLDIIRSINSKPTSIIYHSERVPNVRERVSKPLKYIATEDTNDQTTVNKQPVNKDYEMLDLSSPNDSVTNDNTVTQRPSLLSGQSAETARDDTPLETLLFETNDRVVKQSDANNRNKSTRSECINMWANQLQDAGMLLSVPDDNSHAVNDPTVSSIRSQIDDGVRNVRTLEQELRPFILESVRLQLDKETGLNVVDKQIQETAISAELDRQLRLRATEMKDQVTKLQKEYESQVNSLTMDLTNSKRLAESLKIENNKIQEALNRQLEVSDKTLIEMNSRLDKQTAQYNELRDKYTNLRSELRSSLDEREQNHQLTDAELTSKNTIIQSLQIEQEKMRNALEGCLGELQDTRDIMNREKDKNKNLLEKLKERQSEKTVLEQKFTDEINALQEREKKLKNQLYDNKTRIDLLTRESQSTLGEQCGQQMLELEKKSQDFQKKYELLENVHRKKLEDTVQRLNDEMMRNTEIVTSTMQKKIDILKTNNKNLETDYILKLEKIQSNKDNQDRQENEQLRVMLCDKDQRILELSRALDDTQKIAQTLQSLNVNINQTIEDVATTELNYETTLKSGITKKLRNTRYARNRKTPYPTQVIETLDTGDVGSKLVRVVDGMLVQAQQQQNNLEPPRLYTITDPLNIDQLQAIIDKIWIYIGNLSRDEYHVQSKRVITSITFKDFKTVQSSKMDVSTFAPLDLFRYMGKGEYATTNALFILSEYWFYYERNVQFVHACIERACWTVLTITMLKDLASKIVTNTPDNVYKKYIEKKETSSDRHEIIKLRDVFNNITTDDTYNVERFKILYTDYKRSIDERTKLHVDRVL